MEYFTKTRQVALRAGSIGLVLATLAAISQRWPVAFGVMIGCLVALVNFRLLARSIPRVLSMSFATARKAAAGGYVLRYLLTVVMVLMVNANPNINVWAAFVGLMLVKAVIFGEALYIFVRQKFPNQHQSAREERGEN